MKIHKGILTADTTMKSVEDDSPETVPAGSEVSVITSTAGTYSLNYGPNYLPNGTATHWGDVPAEAVELGEVIATINEG